MRIGVMTPQLVAGDAISNDAKGMYQALYEAGYEVYLFTGSGESATPWDTFNYADASWKLTSPEDLLIYHYCTADHDALTALRRLRCRLAIKYHNVTPSKYMAPYSILFTRMTRLGRILFGEFMDLPCDWIIGDSEYNTFEVRNISDGAARTLTLPVFSQAGTLRHVAEDPATLSYLGRFATNILSVGRIAPNKGHARMLEAFGAALRERIDRPHLHLVGSHDPRLADYIAHLTGIIARHQMADAVSMHPVVGQQALASFYRHCDFYWTASHHEGFCVPAVEAMALGLPIMSSSEGALPETCRDAAIFADGEEETVEALKRMLSDDELLAALSRRGRRRYADQFTDRRIRERFLEFVAGWVEEVRTRAATAAPTGHEIDALDWFDLPHASQIVREALAFHPELGLGGLYARDRRIDLICWVLTEGRRSVPELAEYARSGTLARYAASIEMPHIAAHLSPAQRLAWTFARGQQEIYPLTNAENVAGYLRWFWREGIDLFSLHDFGTAGQIANDGRQATGLLRVASA